MDPTHVPTTIGSILNTDSAMKAGRADTSNDSFVPDQRNK